MNMNYTQEASDRCFALFDKETEQMWEDIAIASESSDKEQWKSVLDKIAREFAISSRFALIRLCQKWACPGEEGKEYSVELDGKILRFRDFTFEHAENLGQEELNSYESLLLDRASTQVDFDLDYARLLIQKALAINIGKKKQSLLTREEALKLGHILNFSLEDMQWFLLRALDMGEGFRYNSSEDLIEAYGFLISSSWQHVDDIKKQYAKKVERIIKKDFSDKPVDWTRSINASLPELIYAWDVANRDSLFLDWMEKQSPYLDLPSKTATRIYRDLAVYAYNMIRGEESAPVDSDFVLVVRQITGAKEEDDRTIDVLWDKADIAAAGITITNERAQTVQFSNPYYAGDVVMAVLKSKDDLFTSLSQLDGKRIGVQSGTIHDEIVLKMLPNAKISYFNSYPEMVEALKDSEIDGFPGDEPVLQMMTSRRSMLKILDDHLDSFEFGFVLPKSEEGDKLLGEINTWLAEVKESGELDKVVTRWISGPKSGKKIPNYTGYPARNGTLTMATEGEYVPMNYSLNDEVMGIEIDLAAQFCKAHGYGFNVETMDFDSILPAIKTEKGIISQKKCKELVGTLLLENLNFSLSDQTDKAKAWHYLKMKNGKLTASGGIDISRTRVQELLTGSEVIEKADMLYLLWFLANMCWFDNGENPTTNDVFNRLADFIDASELCLDQAMLPGFYPPHALEQSMMLSIIYGGASGRDPAEIYEEICASVTETRAKHTNKKQKKTLVQ